jgi:hypothetical protein
MHLHHPALSLNGKKKGKHKFRNAEEARKARELDESWKDLLKRQGIEQEERKRTRAMNAGSLASSGYRLSVPDGRNTTDYIKSRGDFTGNATMPPPKVYTGTKVKGIATMHKSNAVPVFSDEEAIDISKMRR